MNSSNVLIISSEFPPGPGGIGKHAYDLAQALEEKKFNVTVCTSQDHCSPDEISQFNETLPAGLKLIRFTRGTVGTYTRRWLAVRQLVKSLNPGLVVVTGRFPSWMGWLVQTFLGKQTEVHAFIHGSELSNRNALHHMLTVKSLRKIKYLWAVSTFTKNLVEQNTGRGDIRVMPNGLWIADWAHRENGHASMQIMGAPALLTVGRISPRKGQQHVIKAMPELIRHFPKIHYHVVGIDGMKGQLKTLAAKSGLGDRVTFHGRIPSSAQLARIYQLSQVLIILSENQPDGEVEGFGIVILEANLFGIPAIGARGCGIDEAIRDGYNGILVDRADPVQIRKAMQRIMDHYAEFSNNAREWARLHNWNSLASGFLKKESQNFTSLVNGEAQLHYAQNGVK